MNGKNDGLRQYRAFAGILGLITVSVLLLVATHTTSLPEITTFPTGPQATQH